MDLVVWNQLKDSIQKAHSVIDLYSIRDRAEAYRYAAKLAGESIDVINKATEIKLRAERRAGELLRIMPKQGAGEYQRSPGRTAVPSYKDLGINKRDASKWQLLSQIPDRVFEAYIKETKILSSSGAVAVAKSYVAKSSSQTVTSFREGGRYSVIYADPPWAYGDSANKDNRWGGAITHYPTLSIQELIDFKVHSRSIVDLKNENSLLFLWTTGPMFEDAFTLMKGWGFTYKTIAFTWVKKNNNGTPFLGMGSYTRANAEYCLLGVSGKGLKIQDHGISSIVETGTLSHSEKPTIVRDSISRLCGDVPRIELFARKQFDGWDFIGNQVSE